jgi:hypothetical protein
MRASPQGFSTPCNSWFFWAAVIQTPRSMTHFARVCPNLYMYSKYLAGVQGLVGNSELRGEGGGHLREGIRGHAEGRS